MLKSVNNKTMNVRKNRQMLLANRMPLLTSSFGYKSIDHFSSGHRLRPAISFDCWEFNKKSPETLNFCELVTADPILY